MDTLNELLASLKLLVILLNNLFLEPGPHPEVDQLTVQIWFLLRERWLCTKDKLSSIRKS